jgi:hypothetical protein
MAKGTPNASKKRSPNLVESSSGDLPGDLSELLEEVHRAELDVRVAEAKYARSLALLAGAARGRRVGGASAIGICANALGMARQTLQPFAIIAARWSQQELDAIFERRRASGRPLTTSHLLCIARLPRGARREWIQRALHEDLDVRALRESIASEMIVRASGDDGDCRTVRQSRSVEIRSMDRRRVG